MKAEKQLHITCATVKKSVNLWVLKADTCFGELLVQSSDKHMSKYHGTTHLVIELPDFC